MEDEIMVNAEELVSDSDKPILDFLKMRGLKSKLTKQGPIDPVEIADINAKLKKLSKSYKLGMKKKSTTDSSAKGKGTGPSAEPPTRKTRSAVRMDAHTSAVARQSRKGKAKQVAEVVVEVDDDEEVDESVPGPKNMLWSFSIAWERESCSQIQIRADA